MRTLPTKQSAIALITVLVVFSSVTLLSVHLLSNWSIQSHRTSNIINTSKAHQYLYGAEEFSKSLLSQFFEQEKDAKVHRKQDWAQAPMVFPIEQNRGKLEGELRDMHSCFNLNSILMEVPIGSTGGKGSGAVTGNGLSGNTNIADTTAVASAEYGKQLAGEKLFEKLIEPLISDSEVSPKALAAALRDWLDSDQEPSSQDGAEDYHYTGFEIPYRTADTLLAHSSELMVIKGFNAQIYDEIKDMICVLPTKEGTINVNTVKPEQAELVWILLEDAELSEVRQALEDMPDDGYDIGSFFDALSKGKLADEGKGRLAFDSKYMLLTATAQIQAGKAQTKTLLLKKDSEFQVVARHIGE